MGRNKAIGSYAIIIILNHKKIADMLLKSEICYIRNRYNFLTGFRFYKKESIVNSV